MRKKLPVTELAFPSLTSTASVGMTKRELFAGLIMAASASISESLSPSVRDADLAVKGADLLIEALEKPPQNEATD